MGSEQTFKPTSAFITVPQNYPQIPTPGKIEILWNKNKISLWHRLSPYSSYSNSILGTGLSGNEPFYYVYPDEKNKGFNALRKYESRAFPMGSGPIDVIRVSKFLGSGRGIAFLGKQFLLQTGNVYNETRIYNPLSPITATTSYFTLGATRPTRHLNIAGGLAGIAQSVLGSVGTAIFGAPKNDPPSGTVGAGALPPMGQNDGKGLLRAGTANKGKDMLAMKWPVSSGGASSSGGFFNNIKGMITDMFSNFIPKNQKGITYRSDEGAYGRMISSGQKPTRDGGPARFGYTGGTGQQFKFIQRWVGGSTRGIRKNFEYSEDAGRLFITADGRNVLIKNDTFISDKLQNSNLQIGIDMPSNKTKEVKYGDAYGKATDKDSGIGSDVMIQYGMYSSQGSTYPTKLNDINRAKAINEDLQKVLNHIRTSAGGNVYSVTVPPDAGNVRSGKSEINGYERIVQMTDKKQSPINYSLGMLKDYREIVMIDNTLTNNRSENSKKFPTAKWFDAINTLEVLDGNKKIKNSRLTNWTTWEPYRDDQIAFFFYDVVNDKFIPFRATVQGLAETGNATWEELPFIGRGDKVYSYGGFNRSLTVSFHIHINSISEMGPTYQRLNYLSTLIKPANYTSDEENKVMNRFMVPPMVMLTLGDLYKDQPVLIQTMATTVPDDASWETLNEENTLASEGWSYLANFIKAPNVLYGQLPRSIDVSLTLILLEKERSIVGGANFGHAPRKTDGNENWKDWNGQTPKKIHQNMVVNVVEKSDFEQDLEVAQNILKNNPNKKTVTREDIESGRQLRQRDKSAEIFLPSP